VKPITCFRCGQGALRAKAFKFAMCLSCTSEHNAENRAACSKVSHAVLKGLLPRVSTQVCVDCGAPAKDYDHQDYTRPLAVEPTCRPCNHKRGPSLDSKARSLPNRIKAA
jgi:hypothetical protein